MLVQADAVVAELVHLLPALEVLFVGPRRDLGIEVIQRQRVGEVLGFLVLVEMLGVGQQVEDEDFHSGSRYFSACEILSFVRPGLAPGIHAFFVA